MQTRMRFVLPSMFQNIYQPIYLDELTIVNTKNPFQTHSLSRLCQKNAHEKLDFWEKFIEWLEQIIIAQNQVKYWFQMVCLKVKVKYCDIFWLSNVIMMENDD